MKTTTTLRLDCCCYSNSLEARVVASPYTCRCRTRSLTCFDAPSGRQSREHRDRETWRYDSYLIGLHTQHKSFSHPIHSVLLLQYNEESMADTEHLEAVLAQWRDATTPLDGTARVDTTLFLSSSARSARHSNPRALSSSAHTSEDSIVPHSHSSTAAASDDAHEKSCRPWSHDDFLARAATFSIATWFAKPDAISVFACARHGWINTTQPDELYCPRYVARAWHSSICIKELTLACAVCICVFTSSSCEQRLCFTIDPALSEQVRRSHTCASPTHTHTL